MRPEEDGKEAFRFPELGTDPEQRGAWVAVVDHRLRLPMGGRPFNPCHNHRVCQDHFFTGRPSPLKGHPDYVPSILPWNEARRPGSREEWQEFKLNAQRAVEAAATADADPLSVVGGDALFIKQEVPEDAVEEGHSFPCENPSCAEKVSKLEAELKGAREEIERLKQVCSELRSSSKSKVKNIVSEKTPSAQPDATKNKKMVGVKRIIVVKRTKKPLPAPSLTPVDTSQVPSHIRLQVEQRNIHRKES